MVRTIGVGALILGVDALYFTAIVKMNNSVTTEQELLSKIYQKEFHFIQKKGTVFSKIHDKRIIYIKFLSHNKLAHSDTMVIERNIPSTSLSRLNLFNWLNCFFF